MAAWCIEPAVTFCCTTILISLGATQGISWDNRAATGGLIWREQGRDPKAANSTALCLLHPPPPCWNSASRTTEMRQNPGIRAPLLTPIIQLGQDLGDNRHCRLGARARQDHRGGLHPAASAKHHLCIHHTAQPCPLQGETLHRVKAPGTPKGPAFVLSSPCKWLQGSGLL